MSKLISVLLTDIHHPKTALKCCVKNVACNVNWTLSGTCRPMSVGIMNSCENHYQYSTAVGLTGSRFHPCNGETFREICRNSDMRNADSRKYLAQSNNKLTPVGQGLCLFMHNETLHLQSLENVSPRSNNQHPNRTTSIHENIHTNTHWSTLSYQNNSILVKKLRTCFPWNQVGPLQLMTQLQSTQTRMFSSSSIINYPAVMLPRSGILNISSSIQCLSATTHVERGMAGHSKWQNIKATKGTKDVQRGMLFSKLSMKLRIAVREGGGDDPKFNNQLSRVIAEARSKDMPNSSVEAAIKSAAGKDGGSLVVIEMRGPGSCLWVLETFTDKLKKTKMELAGLIKKHGCSLAEGHSAVGAFDKKGVLEVQLDSPDQPINMDDILEVAIETGAEDVEQRVDDDDNKFLAFITDPDDLLTVKKALEGRQLPVKDYYFDYTARVPAIVGDADLKNLQTLANKIHGHSDVLRVFDNIQISE